MADRGLTYVRATVVSRRDLTPHLLRLEVEWDAGSELRRCGSADEALVVVLPAEGEDASVPGESAAGDEGLRERARWYTVRSVDDAARRLVLDVVKHDVGVVTTWAQAAEPGARLAISSTTGWYSPPEGVEWQLLCGDITALPAIARIVDETAADVATSVLVELPDAADEAYLAGSGVPVSVLRNKHLGHGSRLPERLRSHEIARPGTGYVYVAGETSATRAVRRFLRHERGMEKSAYGVIGYWTVDRERWAALWNEHGEELAAIYAGVDEPGADVEAVIDVYEARIDELVAAAR